MKSRGKSTMTSSFREYQQSTVNSKAAPSIHSSMQNAQKAFLNRKNNRF